jgi:PPK2 family polyphosphate:nucleotide phosphotransferase
MKHPHAVDPARLAAAYRVTDGAGFRLAYARPGDTGPFDGKAAAKGLRRAWTARMTELQDKLYAQDRWAVLFIFQALDAGGKDGAIKHVMSGVNPQGCQVYSFKAPSAEELDHDYLWRCAKALPERGRIGIFNRSYYEEVLVVRVHPEVLARQHLPPRLVTERIWEERYEDIRRFERYLGRNGTVIRKFFLHLSREEQKARFLGRLSEPEKHWKFSAADVRERGHWEAYQRAYEDAIRATSTPEAPWYVVPADHKWFTRLVISAAILETLESLALAYPVLSPAARAELAEARQALADEA